MQYACGEYAALLATHGIQASMSRVGNPYDNARAESFIKTLKQKEVDGSAYRDVGAARPPSRPSSRMSIIGIGCTRRWLFDPGRVRGRKRNELSPITVSHD